MTEAARADLQAIGDWIAEANRSRAFTFVEELEAACQGLSCAPARFQLVERYASLSVRRRVHGAYLILYQIGVDRVTVLRIVHGARDYEPLIVPDEEPPPLTPA
ncbi:MAG: type II toxin-antitoxin system RelE/ParE family toxin [Caulobacterales bacterium]